MKLSLCTHFDAADGGHNSNEIFVCFLMQADSKRTERAMKNNQKSQAFLLHFAKKNAITGQNGDRKH